jgi:NADH-quinone oxidoreductase subunit L
MTSIVGFIPFSHYVAPSLIPFKTHFHWNIAIPSVAIGMVGIAIAAFLYLKPKATADKIANAMPRLYKLSLRKFYIDEIYIWVTHSIIFNSISRPIAWFDKKIVDGSMDGMAWVTNKVSDKTKDLQSGQLQQYAFVMIAGVVGLALFILYYLN